MYEMLLYIGCIMCGIFMLLSIYLFVKNKITVVIRYFLKMDKKVNNSNRNLQQSKQKKITSKTPKYDKTVVGTQLLDQNTKGTEILEIAQNYATAVLEVEETTLLPDLNNDY